MQELLKIAGGTDCDESVKDINPLIDSLIESYGVFLCHLLRLPHDLCTTWTPAYWLLASASQWMYWQADIRTCLVQSEAPFEFSQSDCEMFHTLYTRQINPCFAISFSPPTALSLSKFAGLCPSLYVPKRWRFYSKVQLFLVLMSMKCTLLLLPVSRVCVTHLLSFCSCISSSYLPLCPIKEWLFHHVLHSPSVTILLFHCLFASLHCPCSITLCPFGKKLLCLLPLPPPFHWQ